MISAHYGFSDVFDNLIISLCKFTTLSSEVRDTQTPHTCPSEPTIPNNTRRRRSPEDGLDVADPGSLGTMRCRIGRK